MHILNNLLRRIGFNFTAISSDLFDSFLFRTESCDSSLKPKVNERIICASHKEC